MKGDEKFLGLYKKLNKAQKEAVDTIEGPVMVVAGPGTGKTQILTLRIANILRQTDTAPEQILALTFTEAGASAMRARLATIIGVTAYRVPIFTFHGFCNEVISRFPEFFPEILGSRPASEIDRIKIMQEVFDNSSFEHLASFRSPYHYVKPSLGTVSLLKREAIDSQELRNRLDKEEKEILSAVDYRHEKGAHKGKVKGVYLERELAIAKNRELATLYDGYETGLANKKLFDFDDMIIALVRGLEKNEELKLILQEEYQYLLADEHQDANGAQNKVLELLSSFHDSPNLFIVGDDKQAIYRFQGASLENFLYFHKRFSSTKLIDLVDNYRSTQTVLDTAYKLIGNRGVKLNACVRHNEKQILVREYLGVEDEADAVAGEVSEKIKDGIAPNEIAIFTRTNKELSKYSAALFRAGVPVAIETKEDILEDREIEKILLLINSAAKIGEDGPLIKAMHLNCFDIPELDIYLLLREASQRHESVWQIACMEKDLEGLKLQNAKEVIRVVGLITKWSKTGYNSSLAEVLSVIAKESGIIGQILKDPNALVKLNKLGTLLSYLESYTRSNRGARINDLSQLLDLVDEYNVLEVDSKNVNTDKVRLCTAHRSKGLEFDHVYIVGANEGVWSGGRSRSDFKLPGIVAVSQEDEEADDRRLFYVAMTRARKELVVSYPTLRGDGKLLLPTRFLEELLTECVVRENHIQPPTSAEMLSRLVPIELPQQEMEDVRNFVRETLLERGLAVTGLNNYLKCPWQYFYRTLLRVPEPQTVPLMFGNAVHHTMKAFFDAWGPGRQVRMSQENMSREGLLSRLELELERESLTDKELNDAKKEGREALGSYYDFWYPSWSRDIKNEFPIDILVSVGGLEIRLTGKLDKMEFDKDGVVSVIDYKTGKPKSRNFIEGKTKEEGAGDYKRQLVFYKLLLDQYNGGKFNMERGIIDFVMPDDKGRFHREEFVITKGEVSALISDVLRVLDEILSLSFWNKRCDDLSRSGGDKTCEYCKLREMVN